MIARQRGHLVGISSLASYRGLPKMAGYCASKAGLNSLLEGLRVELNPLGIVVTTICPGWIRTPLTANVSVKMPMLEVAEASRHIRHAIHRQHAYYAFPGRDVRRLRLLKWLPASVSDWLTRRALGRLKAD
jgi:short-subunit dehydrogenase